MRNGCAWSVTKAYPGSMNGGILNGSETRKGVLPLPKHEVNVLDVDALLRSMASLLKLVGEAISKEELDTAEGYEVLLLDQAEKLDAVANILCSKCRLKEVRELIETTKQ